MDTPTMKKNFLRDDLYNSLKELLIGAVTWKVYDEGKDPRYEPDLGMFTCFAQARALYEFFYVKRNGPEPGSTASACHFAGSAWRPRDKQSLYSRYMAKRSRLRNESFISCTREPTSRRRGVGRIWSPEEPSACYRKGLDAAYAGVRSNICPGRSGDLEGALARAVHDCHELAMSYKITDPLQDP